MQNHSTSCSFYGGFPVGQKQCNYLCVHIPIWYGHWRSKEVVKQLKDLKSQLAQLKTQLEESLIEQQRLEGKLSTTETWQVKRGGRKLGDNEERWTRFVMAIPNADACGCFAHWELPLKSTEEKRAEEAETKNQELEVQIFFIAVQRAPPNPHVFWCFQFLKWSFYVWFPYE